MRRWFPRRWDTPGDAPWSVGVGWLLLIAAVAVVLGHPGGVGDLGKRAPSGGQGDVGLVLFWLSYVAHAVVHGQSVFASTFLNYPHGASSMWNTSLLLPGVLLAPVTLAFGPAASYALLLLLAPLTNAVGAFALARRLTGWAPAVLAGLVFAFNPFVTAELPTHPFLSLCGLVPVIVLCALRLLDAPDRGRAVRRGAALGAVVAAQMFVAEEVAVLAGLAVGVVTVLLAAQRPRAVRGAVTPVALGAAVAAGVLLLLVGPALLGYQFAQRWVITHPVHPRDFYEAVLPDLVHPTLTVLSGSRHPAGAALRFGGSEQGMFVGWPLLVVCAAGAVLLARRLAVRTAAVGVVLAVVASLGGVWRRAGSLSGSRLPWYYLENLLPPLQNVISIRLALLMWLGLALLVALLVQHVPGDGRWPARVALGLIAACLVPVLPRPVHPFPRLPRTPLYFTDGVREIPRGAVVLLAPVGGTFHTNAMLWQMAAGMRFRMFGGYSLFNDPLTHRASYASQDPLSQAFSDPPRGAAAGLATGAGRGRAADEMDVPVDPATLALLQGEVRDDHVRDIIIGPSRDQERLLDLAALVTGRPPDAHTEGVWLWQLA